MERSMIILLTVFGAMMILAGIFCKIYPHSFRFLVPKDISKFEWLAQSKILGPVLDLLTGKSNSRRHKLSQRIINRSETEISVRALYLMKVISLVTVTVISLLVSLTNTNVLKLSIMSKPQEGFLLFQDAGLNDYSRNASLYRAVVGRIGEETLRELGEKERLEEVEKLLPGLLGTGERAVIEEKAAGLVKAFDRINRLNPFNLWMILAIILSFWLPELVLLLKRLLLGNSYRKEVIRLENIFELLGSIRNFKTLDILREMAKSSRVYKKHLESGIELFKTEREMALNNLKVSVKNSRFSRLVDILRVYSMTDKKLALQIMERTRLEKEEEILLTAEEDMDLVDLVAFISIIPILLQLASLMLKPMLDVIYEAFKFI